MAVINNTLRSWLIQSGYKDIADLIEEIMLEWKSNGRKTRRNWWDKIAGSKNGQELFVSGRRIPILRTAQLRKGYPVTPNALFKETEIPIIPKKGRGRSNK